jgi:hypothetical protein
MDPDDDQQLSVELLMCQLVEQASLIMTAHERVKPPAHSNPPNRPSAFPASSVASRRRDGTRCRWARYAALRVIGADGLLG